MHQSISPPRPAVSPRDIQLMRLLPLATSYPTPRWLFGNMSGTLLCLSTCEASKWSPCMASSWLSRTSSLPRSSHRKFLLKTRPTRSHSHPVCAILVCSAAPSPSPSPSPFLSIAHNSRRNHATDGCRKPSNSDSCLTTVCRHDCSRAWQHNNIK